MGLKATKVVGNAPAKQAATQEAPAQEEVQQAAPQTAPAVQNSAAVAKPMGGSGLADLNAGILEGIEDIGGGNFVTVDGTDFLYKSSNDTVDHIDIVVSYGKKFYQWVDDSSDNKVFHNSDTKLDDRYKLKFEVKWYEDRGEEEPTEFTQTFSTTSTMNFFDYIKKLGGLGLGVNQVVTRLTISRQVSKDGKNRYSRVEMEAFDLDAYQNGELKALGVKTQDAKQIG